MLKDFAPEADLFKPAETPELLQIGHQRRSSPRYLHCYERLLILLYYFCNPPFVGYFYSLPSEGNYLIINKNLVEAAGLFVTMVMSSGRYYGMDRIIHKLVAGRALRGE